MAFVPVTEKPTTKPSTTSVVTKSPTINGSSTTTTTHTTRHPDGSSTIDRTQFTTQNSTPNKTTSLTTKTSIKTTPDGNTKSSSTEILRSTTKNPDGSTTKNSTVTKPSGSTREKISTIAPVSISTGAPIEITTTKIEDKNATGEVTSTVYQEVTTDGNNTRTVTNNNGNISSTYTDGKTMKTSAPSTGPFSSFPTTTISASGATLPTNFLETTQPAVDTAIPRVSTGENTRSGLNILPIAAGAVGGLLFLSAVAVIAKNKSKVAPIEHISDIESSNEMSIELLKTLGIVTKDTSNGYNDAAQIIGTYMLSLGFDPKANPNQFIGSFDIVSTALKKAFSELKSFKRKIIKPDDNSPWQYNGQDLKELTQSYDVSSPQRLNRFINNLISQEILNTNLATSLIYSKIAGNTELDPLSSEFNILFENFYTKLINGNTVELEGGYTKLNFNDFINQLNSIEPESIRNYQLRSDSSTEEEFLNILGPITLRQKVIEAIENSREEEERVIYEQPSGAGIQGQTIYNQPPGQSGADEATTRITSFPVMHAANPAISFTAPPEAEYAQAQTGDPTYALFSSEGNPEREKFEAEPDYIQAQTGEDDYALLSSADIVEARPKENIYLEPSPAFKELTQKSREFMEKVTPLSPSRSSAFNSIPPASSRDTNPLSPSNQHGAAMPLDYISLPPSGSTVTDSSDSFGFGSSRGKESINQVTQSPAPLDSGDNREQKPLPTRSLSSLPPIPTVLPPYRVIRDTTKTPSSAASPTAESSKLKSNTNAIVTEI